MQPTPLDPQVVNLAKAVRQTESGGNFNAKGASGESGAYQWMPNTWKAHAQQALGDQNAPMTPANQNAVAYTVLKSWRDQGLNPAQIAAKWNSGSETGWENKIGVNSMGVKYNVPQYVKSVTDAYQQIKGGSQNPSIIPNPSTVGQTQYGTQKPGITGNETPVQAGLNALKNTPGDVVEFGKGALQTINPLQIADTASQIGSGFQELSQDQGTGGALWSIIKGLPQATYETLVPQGIRQVIGGDIQGASKTFQEHPFSTVAPVVLGLEGGAKAFDRFGPGNAMAAENIVNKGGTFNVAPGGKVVNPGAATGAFNAAVDTAATVAKPVTKAITGAAAVPVALGRSVVSHLTGLNPETIVAIINDPASFSKLKQEAASRPSVAADFKAGVDQFFLENSEIGSEYQPIRSSTEQIRVPIDWADKVLENKGFKIDISNGTIEATTKSATRNPTDINALQRFYDNWGQKKMYTPEEFLNMRTDLADLANYDKMNTGMGKTKTSSVIANDLRQEANNIIRPKIKGLEELDTRMAPRLELAKRLKRDFLNADGTFKDGAPSKIINALNKEGLLARMEQIQPGITKSIELLKAVEDIQRANGLKVGNYTRGIIEGGGVLSGNIPVIISAILTHPTIAVQILRGFGITGKGVTPIVGALQVLTGQTGPALKAAGVAQGNQTP